MEDAYYKAMALADGELNSGDLPALAHTLVRDSALMRATQVCMDLRRGRLARIYARRVDEPVPQHLIDTVMTAPMGRPARRSAPLFGALIEWVRGNHPIPGWSLAAGPAFAALVAISASWLLVPAAGSATVMTPQIQAALERGVSNGGTALPGLRFLQTYWSSDDGWCREFNVASDAQQTSAVACRWGEGMWRIVLQTPTVGPGAIGTAGTPRDHLDRYVQSRMSAPPLQPDQVEKVIKSEWAPPAER